MMCTMSQEGCDIFGLTLLAPLHAGGLSTLESTEFVDHNQIHTVKVAMPPYDIWSTPPPTIVREVSQLFPYFLLLILYRI